MPYLHCGDCGYRTFKNWDAEDTDDEDDFYCANCATNVQWITEAEYAERRKRRRSGEQQRQSSEEYRLQQQLFEEDVRRKMELQQQKRERELASQQQDELQRQLQEQRQLQSSPIEEGAQRVVTVTPKPEAIRPHSPMMAATFTQRAVHPVLPLSLSPSHSTTPRGLDSHIIDVLLREIPTLQVYFLHLREEIEALRCDKTTALEEAAASCRQVAELEKRNNQLEQSVAFLTSENVLLTQNNAELRNQNDTLQAQLNALPSPCKPPATTENHSEACPEPTQSPAADQEPDALADLHQSEASGSSPVHPSDPLVDTFDVPSTETDEPCDPQGADAMSTHVSSDEDGPFDLFDVSIQVHRVSSELVLGPLDSSVASFGPIPGSHGMHTSSTGDMAEGSAASLDLPNISQHRSSITDDMD